MASLSEITPGSRFRHYKQKDYEVLTLATDEATEDPVVVYRALYGDFGVWVRRVSSFCETIEFEGQTVERFSLITV